MTHLSDSSAPVKSPTRATARQRSFWIQAQVAGAHWISHLHLMTVPALLPVLPGYLGVNYLELGVAISVVMLVTIVLQSPMGFIVDRVGARSMLTVALVTGAVAFVSLTLWQSYPLLLAAMACVGVANTIYHPADYALLAQGVPDKQMGRAYSVHTFSGYFGTAVAPGILLGIAYTAGVSWAFLFSAVVAVAAAVFLNAPVPGKAEMLTTMTGQLQAQDPSKTALSRKVWWSSDIVWLTALFAFLTFSTSTLQEFGVTTLTVGYDRDPTLANIAISTFLLASAFGVLIGGWLADISPKHGLITAASFLAAAFTILPVIFFELPAPLLVALLGLTGLLMGLIPPSRDMMVRALAPPGTEGRIFGIVSTGYSIGGFVAPLLFGAMIDHGFAQAVFWSAPLLMLIVAGLSFRQEFRMRRLH